MVGDTMSGPNSVAATVLRMEAEAKKIKQESGLGSLSTSGNEKQVIPMEAGRKRYNDDPRRGTARIYFLDECNHVDVVLNRSNMSDNVHDLKKLIFERIQALLTEHEWFEGDTSSEEETDSEISGMEHNETPVVPSNELNLGLIEIAEENSGIMGTGKVSEATTTRSRPTCTQDVDNACGAAKGNSTGLILDRRKLDADEEASIDCPPCPPKLKAVDLKRRRAMSPTPPLDQVLLVPVPPRSTSAGAVSTVTVSDQVREVFPLFPRDLQTNRLWQVKLKLRTLLRSGPRFFMLKTGGTKPREGVWLSNERAPLNSYRLGFGPPNAVIPLYLVPSGLMPPADITAMITSTKTAVDIQDRAYTLYVIMVQHGDLRWVVERRLKKFQSLHDKLKKMASDGAFKLSSSRLVSEPTAFTLPSLPSKRIMGSMTEAVIIKRRQKLQQYLNQVLESEGCRQSVAVLSFLGLLSTTRHLVMEKILGQEVRDVINLTSISNHAKFGDVVMFKCTSAMSGLQRIATRSEWDHVGLVVRSRSRQALELLEATGDGCQVFPLTPRLRAYSSEFTKYMALRRLSGPRPIAMLRLMNGFLNRVDGKPYGLPPSKLLARSKQGDPNKEKDFFFCSELVAEALRHIGVMDVSWNSAYFWPKSFASGGDVEKALLPQYHYGPEIMIDCRSLEIGAAQRTTN